ncbi:uncharacterized protein LOC132736275 [Ruditapes philippinarum]|uniref:uncharacterized protein LOC132736275 n=1 Tax=Ruditapes philippinarum TaxID=129788 RepID=UPI00295AB6D0|nr:uncharacterized protein LOC132736275 [Ruditapes philippinarum]
MSFNSTISTGTSMSSSSHFIDTTSPSAELLTTTITFTRELSTESVTNTESDVDYDITSEPLLNQSYEDYDYDYKDIYMYPGYSFERPVYLYIWEILVIFVFLVNIIVIMVLLSRKMRNATNMILAAIAVSDSLTGLVTLPSYIMVYMRYDPLPENYGDQGNYSYNDYTPIYLGNDTTYGNDYYGSQMAQDGYSLSKNLCNGFMISKYFLSKSFHTISIFLTLFLGIQRYVSVAYPFKSHFLFSEGKTLIWCGVIFAVSPVLHSYHLGSNKAVGGLCQWELAESGCGAGCIYLWFAFFLRHLIPCVTLFVFTGLFIRHLHLGERNLRRMDSTASQLSRRVVENRRISIIVTAIVIVFLVPEIPYGIFLLYNAMQKTLDNGKGIKLESNRAIHMSYELLLVVSFHANFYIYTILNRRFRKCLYRTFIKPVQRYVGDPRRLSVVSRTSSNSLKTSTRKTEFSSKSGHELNYIRRKSSEKSGTLDTKFMESFSCDITQSSHQDAHELQKLNANV